MCVREASAVREGAGCASIEGKEKKKVKKEKNRRWDQSVGQYTARLRRDKSLYMRPRRGSSLYEAPSSAPHGDYPYTQPPPPAIMQRESLEAAAAQPAAVAEK